MMSPRDVERLSKLKNRMQKIKLAESKESQIHCQDGNKTWEMQISVKEQYHQSDDEVICIDDDLKDRNEVSKATSIYTRKKNGLRSSNNGSIDRKIKAIKAEVISIKAEPVGREYARNCNEEPDVEIIKIETLSSSEGARSRDFVPSTPDVEIEVMPSSVAAVGSERFFHFPLDNLQTYFCDNKWLAKVQSVTVRKYYGSPSELDQCSMRLFIFLNTVTGLKGTEGEGKLIQVAIEALYLKTLYRERGASRITACLMEKISFNTINTELMTILYLIHLIITIEKRFFNIKGGILLYRDTFQKMQFAPRFKEIVTLANPGVKKELYSLRLRWTTLFVSYFIKEIDKDDFWALQGLNPKYMQLKTEKYSQNLKKMCSIHQTTKSEVKGKCSPPQSPDTDSVRAKPNRRRPFPIKNPVELVYVSSSDDSSSSVEIIKDLARKTKKLCRKKKQKLETDKTNCIILDGEEIRPNGKYIAATATKDKPENGEIAITSIRSMANIVTSSPTSSTTGDSSSNSKTTDKTENMVVVNGQFVSMLDGKSKKTREELQQMLMRTKSKKKRTRAPNKTVVPNSCGSVRQIQVANVMSQEFVDNLLTPTLANFEIVYGEDGTAKTKFTHLA